MTKLKVNTQREYRFIQALLRHGSVSRKDMDEICGAQNSPEVKRSLKDRGWPIKCQRVKMYDRDGNACYPGVYYLEERDLCKAMVAVED